MDLTNDFHVALPVERAWAVLTDLERIAPCMPGAQLQEVEGDEFRGVVKVKVGPMTAQYKGKARFLSQDSDGHVAVLRAEGQETRGQGTASATITARLEAAGDGTDVSLVTDLAITGRVAQFGRGVLADVSQNLLGQFVECLEKTIVDDEPPAASTGAPASDDGGGPAAPVDAVEAAPDAVDHSDPAPGPAEIGPDVPAAPVAAAAGPAEAEAASSPVAAASPVRKIESPEAQPIDLMGAAGSPVAKRVGPILGLLAVVWLLKKLFGRKR